ncbi:MAG: sigma-54 factor interaction domain-containing protein, partial [Halioglobus sp.]|nr:sigma-54 factor interaction domain-containing protein [Halioglobus sp.]
PELVGQSPRFRKIIEFIKQIAPAQSTVLITGESGTGKEVAATAIHHYSNRRGGPFVKINCGAIPENLLESELFGYEKGAFTGAQKQKKGKIELADDGTLFLDEIGDLARPMQVKLLRVLQDGEIERVGGTVTIQTDVRIVAATNTDLAEKVARGEFREDLFYRLNVISIDMPPLRERPEDVPLL